MFDKSEGVNTAYRPDKTNPMRRDTVRGADAASLAPSALPSPSCADPDAYALDTRPVVALARKLNKYST